jgi:hypothetical protein
MEKRWKPARRFPKCHSKSGFALLSRTTYSKDGIDRPFVHQEGRFLAFPPLSSRRMCLISCGRRRARGAG